VGRGAPEPVTVRARLVGNPRTDFAGWDELVELLHAGQGAFTVRTGRGEVLVVAPGEGYLLDPSGPLPGGVPTGPPDPARTATDA